MFQDKKEAEEYDKMLELAENIATVIEQNLKDVSEEHAETIGLLMAKHREVLAKACRGKPELLLTALSDESSTDAVVTPLSAKI